MSEYVDAVISDKKFKGNVVILINSVYYAIQEPDSGLLISSPFDQIIKSLQLNPTSMDIRRVTTTVSSFSFAITDKDNVLTLEVLGDASGLIGAEVRIWLGRSNITTNSANDMAFVDYYELPRTYVKKLEHSDNSYRFTTTEQTDRMAKEIYNFKSAVSAAVLVGTTVFAMRDDISTFPASGFLKIGDEFVSYASLDLVNNRFDGVIRGELNSIPAAHDIYSEAFLTETLTDNPLNIIMKILISGGGGGVYDTLQDGLGIDQNFVDMAEIEALRDLSFLGVEYTLSLYDISSALKKMEDELLMPNNLRFTTSIDSKITLAELDRAKFVAEDNVMDEDTILKFPKWTIDGNKVANVLEIYWDFSEGTKAFNKLTLFENASSILTYGRQNALVYLFKGVKESLNGAAIVEDFGSRLLARLSTPTPEIEITTQLDKSLQTIGDKAYVRSSQIPAANGTLDFSSDLEIISRGINYQQGTAQFKLTFTSFTNFRSGFIAPSDLIISKTSQKIFGLSSARGTYYRAGMFMRLWNETTQAFEADAINKIESISGDTLTFENNWTTVISTPNLFRLRFADYNDQVVSQKRYASLSSGGADFGDGSQTYKVTF